LYDPAKVTEVYGIDPHPGMIGKAAHAAVNVDFPVKLLCHTAEQIPLDDDSIDTVFSIATFCSIPDLPRALREMRRVLRPGGRLLFFEHGLHPDPVIAEKQRKGEARHKWIYHGCHMTRDIPKAIEEVGFTFEENTAGEQPFGWMFPHVWGWYGAAV
jgi:ubiquinone/menaquinone biosynthesis C-methylase UbiE